MSKPEEDILTALICQLVSGEYKANGEYRTTKASESSARACAKKVLEVGFSMARRPVDDEQDQLIARLQIEIEQLRGWAGLPPELRSM